MTFETGEEEPLKVLVLNEGVPVAAAAFYTDDVKAAEAEIEGFQYWTLEAPDEEGAYEEAPEKFDFEDEENLVDEDLTVYPYTEEITFTTSLNLADYTGVQIYVQLPEGEDPADYTIQATYKSYRQEFTTTATLDTLPDGTGKYTGKKFVALKAASTEMSDKVTVELLKGDEVVKTEEYSVRSITEAALDTELEPAVETLYRSLMQYGHYAQLTFNNKPDDLPSTEGAPALDPTALDAYAPSGDPTGFAAYITKFEGKLDLNDAVKMNLYLTPADGYTIDSFDIKVLDKDGKEYTNFNTSLNKGRIRVQITGVLSPQMARDFKVVVSLKDDATKTATWTRSVLNCAYETAKANAGNENAQKLMQSLYAYWVCSANVFPDRK